jgi:hypothetical protein
MTYLFYAIQFSLMIIILVSYGLLLFWIIPDQIPKDKQESVTKYTNYAFTALTTLLFMETGILTLAGINTCVVPIVGGRRNK